MNKVCKILVLSDINKSIDITLQSAINLAEISNGEVELLCVKKPTEIINKESQLSALRNINQEFNNISKKVKSIISKSKNNSNINITSKVSMGNIKDEISQHIKKTNPDIIVLGKKKSSFLKFYGDNIMSFILKEFNGLIMIASDKKMFEITDNLKLGAINNIENPAKNNVINNILSSSNEPLKLFKIAEGEDFKNNNANSHTEFIFEKNDNVLKNISKYLSKSNIHLLFIDRSKKMFINSKSSILNITNSVDCHLILSPN